MSGGDDSFLGNCSAYQSVSKAKRCASLLIYLLAWRCAATLAPALIRRRLCRHLWCRGLSQVTLLHLWVGRACGSIHRGCTRRLGQHAPLSPPCNDESLLFVMVSESSTVVVQGFSPAHRASKMAYPYHLRQLLALISAEFPGPTARSLSAPVESGCTAGSVVASPA